MLSKLKDSLKKKTSGNKTSGGDSSFDSASDNSNSQLNIDTNHSVALSGLALNDHSSSNAFESKKKSVRKVENEGYLLMQLIGATNLKSADVNGLSGEFLNVNMFTCVIIIITRYDGKCYVSTVDCENISHDYFFLNDLFE